MDYYEMRKSERAISKVLKYLRMKTDKTQLEVAKELNIGASTVSSHENLRSTPDIYTLIKYTMVYKITLAEFFHIVQYIADNSTSTVIHSDITKEAVIFSLTT